MHYHLEIIMPPTDDVEAAVTEILAPFDENHEDDEDKNGHPFWDYWRIGGRYSAAKLFAMIGEERLNEFHKALHEAHITVSSFTAGKQTLQPPEQAGTVNRMWNAMFPDSPVKVCPIFDNYKDDFGDVMSLAEAPKAMKCDHVIVACPDYQDKKLEALFMIQDSVWNGVNHVTSTWDGTLVGAPEMAAEKLKNYKPEYAAKRTPADDWLVVTIDYHS